MKAKDQKKISGGFTLVELMIVVVILGILAAIAIITFTQYVRRAKVSEAYAMLGEIRAKQEAYKAEFSQYCDVSGGKNLDSGLYPATAPTGQKMAWADLAPTQWLQLGFHPDGPVYMCYTTAAGLPGETISGTGAPAIVNTDHWWAARAVGDLDSDGSNYSYYDVTNRMNTVIITNEGE
jgi:prepilin-type N-terminal cleavage/methylation domain-containing protein